MAKPLLKEKDIPVNSIVNGNLDVNRYISELDDAQRRFIRKDLSTDELYQKLCNDYYNNTLTGYYETIYKDYIKWMLIYKALEQYIEVGGVSIANNGITRPSSENNAPLFESEIGKLSYKYKVKYEDYKRDFLIYMQENGKFVPEWDGNKGYNRYNDLGGFLIRK